MRTTLFRSSLSIGLFVVLAVSMYGCGDDSSDGSCDPATNADCVCETEGGGACSDPDDLDCFCFLNDGSANNGANNGATDQATVLIANFTFSPSTVTINAGGQVTWTNNDQAQHTITFADGTIDQLLEPRGTFTATFNTVGTFSYKDRLNDQPGLKGTVTVQ